MRTVGKYTLGPLLGRGGTGEVYDARHSLLGHVVAIKVLRHELAFDDAMVSAFVGEAQRTREIAHPNVVRVFDFGRDAATGCCFLVMERLDGESLAARIAREGALPEHVLRPLGAAIADGMQAAHDRNIVHRDLKPGNVMLRRDAAPAVIDFGVAKSLGAGSAVVTSRRVGTLAYMAPEQLAQGLITPAVDIWALGAILYEAATGRAPFERFEEGRLPQLVETPTAPALLAPISTALSTLIMRCLEREPGRRPSTMTEVARALRGGNADERITQDAGPVVAALPRAVATPVTATPPAPARLPVAHKPLHRGWLVAYAAAAIGVGVAFGLTRTSSKAPPKQPEVSESGTRSEAKPEPPSPSPPPVAVPVADDAIEVDPPPTLPDPPTVTANARPSKRAGKPTKPVKKPTKPTTKPVEKSTKPVEKPPTKHREGLD